MPTPRHAAVRDELGARPLIPYERLAPTLGPQRHTDLPDRLRHLLDHGWEYTSNTLRLQPPVTWSHDNRSFESHVQAWDPIVPLLPQADERRYREPAMAFALDWLATWQVPLLELDRGEALDRACTTAGMAWHSLTVGYRTYRLAYLTDVAARFEEVDDETFALLFDALAFHLDLLARDDFFLGHSNHGLYQALGQAASCRRFAFATEFDGHREQSRERVRTMFERSFFPSGVHREHSPGYHLVILSSLLGARSAGLLDPEMNAVLAKAETALAWMVGPHGVLSAFGDTDPERRELPPSALSHFQSPQAHHALSGGQIGQPPAEGLQSYPDAGVAFFRAAQTYLAQQSAFHSRTHKHADHFSFLWWENDEEVLIDAGRYGYLGKTERGSELFEAGFWYADPRRVYVERTRAHNCVEIDGRDYPRKGVTPFGSALRQAEQQDDLVVTTSETYHFRQVRHRRNLVLRPGHFLLVLDWLFDRSGEEHDFRQWFQLGPQWEACPADEGSAFVSPSGARLWTANLLDPEDRPHTHRGETEPEMSGWRSDTAESLVPTTSLHFSDRGSRGAFATIFLLGDGGTHAGTRANASLTTGRYQWRQDGRVHTVSVTPDGTTMKATYGG